MNEENNKKNSSSTNTKEGKRVLDPEVKARILDLIKDGSVRVKDAAATYGVSPKTIYLWLSQRAAPGQGNSTELIRLRRENKALLELVGRLTAELQQSKKKRW